MVELLLSATFYDSIKLCCFGVVSLFLLCAQTHDKQQLKGRVFLGLHIKKDIVHHGREDMAVRMQRTGRKQAASQQSPVILP